jgi:O-antigen ligase
VRLTRFLFLATVFVVTFEKVRWELAGTVSLADLLALGFLAGYAADRIGRKDAWLPRTALAVLGFLVAFLLVYLLGFFDLASSQAEAQFWKGLVKFVIHFLFLLSGIAYLARRPPRFYLQTLAILAAGMVVNAAYGVLQLLVARSGGNLDAAVLSPLTGGASSINIYGAVEGASVYRMNALTGDPNHLGVMLLVPLLVLTPLYFRLPQGRRWRVPLALLLAFLLLVELSTLSRSGLAGLLAGALVLALPYARRFRSRAFVLPLVGVVAVVAAIVLSRLAYFERVISSRLQTGGRSTSAHFDVYSFVPDILHREPLFGLGLNNFSVYYEQVTGKTNWGPHSFYVALIVETGLVGTTLFLVFLAYLFRRLAAARRLGRLLDEAGDAAGARVRPLAWGMTAALAGTMVANAFYLTMSFYYFFAFAMLALALPVVYGRQPAPAALRASPPRPLPRAAPASGR